MRVDAQVADVEGVFSVAPALRLVEVADDRVFLVALIDAVVENRAVQALGKLSVSRVFRVVVVCANDVYRQLLIARQGFAEVYVERRAQNIGFVFVLTVAVVPALVALGIDNGFAIVEVV